MGCLMSGLFLISCIGALFTGIAWIASFLLDGAPPVFRLFGGVATAALAVAAYYTYRPLSALQKATRRRVEQRVAALDASLSFAVGRYEGGLIKTEAPVIEPEEASTDPPMTQCFVTATELVFVDGLPHGFDERGRIPRAGVKKLHVEPSMTLRVEWEDKRGVSHVTTFSRALKNTVLNDVSFSWA
jgi:hypothetical protein